MQRGGQGNLPCPLRSIYVFVVCLQLSKLLSELLQEQLDQEGEYPFLVLVSLPYPAISWQKFQQEWLPTILRVAKHDT
jgi:hypothetical protein